MEPKKLAAILDELDDARAKAHAHRAQLGALIAQRDKLSHANRRLENQADKLREEKANALAAMADALRRATGSRDADATPDAQLIATVDSQKRTIDALRRTLREQQQPRRPPRPQPLQPQSQAPPQPSQQPPSQQDERQLASTAADTPAERPPSPPAGPVTLQTARPASPWPLSAAQPPSDEEALQGQQGNLATPRGTSKRVSFTKGEALALHPPPQAAEEEEAESPRSRFRPPPLEAAELSSSAQAGPTEAFSPSVRSSRSGSSLASPRRPRPDRATSWAGPDPDSPTSSEVRRLQSEVRSVSDRLTLTILHHNSERASLATQLELARSRAAAAEGRLDALRGDLDARNAQLAELRDRLELYKRAVNSGASVEERKATDAPARVGLSIGPGLLHAHAVAARTQRSGFLWGLVSVPGNVLKWASGASQRAQPHRRDSHFGRGSVTKRPLMSV